MGKHKKTRKEKIITDLRHQLYTLKNYDIPSTPSLEPITKPSMPVRNNSITVSPVNTTIMNSYDYLKHDILKTLTLTLAIIAFQIIFLFVLQRHILLLPGIHY